MILCVVGPTGVGKTKLSETLAKKYDAVIVNCDSMQVYREMNIGTAKYKPEEDLGQPHLLFDIVNPDAVYTVYDYQQDLRRILSEYEDRNVVLVGGTGLYLKAGLYDYEFSERTETNEFEEYSNEELYTMLESQGRADGVHVNNRRRLVSKLNSTGNSGNKDVILYDDVYFIGLTTDRDNLYRKIDERVDKMMSDGLLREVLDLYNRYGLTKAMKTGIGYKELVMYFDGFATLEDAVSLIKQKSRKYAKRQYTWFNGQMDVTWFETNYEDFDVTVNDVIDYIEKNKR